MAPTIFYAWQSYEQKVNRYVIRDALLDALKDLKREGDLFEPRLDSDTENVVGWPDIVPTILAKIEACDVFVADVTIINSDRERLTPNPNVMFELGYALAKLGDKRIILVQNTAFLPADSTLDDMPFDIRGRRGGVSYMLPSNGSPGALRKELAKELTAAVRASLEAGPHAEIIRFLDQTNPEILSLVRSGQQTVAVMVAQHRVSELTKLRAPLFAKHVTITNTGSMSGNNTNRVGGHINDLADGPLVGFRFAFTDTFVATATSRP